MVTSFTLGVCPYIRPYVSVRPEFKNMLTRHNKITLQLYMVPGGSLNLPDCLSTRPPLYRRSLFSHMVSVRTAVRPSVRHKNQHAIALKNDTRLNMAWWVTLTCYYYFSSCQSTVWYFILVFKSRPSKAFLTPTPLVNCSAALFIQCLALPAHSKLGQGHFQKILYPKFLIVYFGQDLQVYLVGQST